MEIRPPRGMDRGFPLSFSRRIWYTVLCYEFHKERGWTVGNVTLIGMPGSGKSTVGVLLAKALGYGFLDTDLVIQQQEGALLQEILDEKGRPLFSGRGGACGALGGVRPARDRPRGQRGLPGGGHRPPEGHAGPVIYLRVPLEELKARIHNLDSRGIALEPGQTLEDIMDLRAPLYERYADAVVDAVPGQSTGPDRLSQCWSAWNSWFRACTWHAPSPQGTVGRPRKEDSPEAE